MRIRAGNALGVSRKKTVLERDDITQSGHVDHSPNFFEATEGGGRFKLAPIQGDIAHADTIRDAIGAVGIFGVNIAAQPILTDIGDCAVQPALRRAEVTGLKSFVR